MRNWLAFVLETIAIACVVLQVLVLARKASGENTKHAEYAIRYHDMDFAGEIIQHMSHALSVTTLACTADFVDEMEEFKRTLYQVGWWLTSFLFFVAGIACVLDGTVDPSTAPLRCLPRTPINLSTPSLPPPPSFVRLPINCDTTRILQVDDYNSIRLKLTAEMADNSGMVKNLVIKAEDARILGDMRLMRKMYVVCLLERWGVRACVRLFVNG